MPCSVNLVVVVVVTVVVVGGGGGVFVCVCVCVWGGVIVAWCVLSLRSDAAQTSYTRSVHCQCVAHGCGSTWTSF